MNKIFRLTTKNDEGQDINVDINIDNFTLAIELNGDTTLHFTDGRTITIASGIWEQIKQEWATK